MPTEVARKTGQSRFASSSPDLSSLPKSPESLNESAVYHSAHSVNYPSLANNNDRADENAQNLVGNAKPSGKGSTTQAPVKKTRKKREPAATTGNSTGTEVKEKKTRKPRATSGSAGPVKKRAKTAATIEPVAASGSRQTRITESLAPPQASPQPAPSHLATVASSQSGKIEVITNVAPVAPPVAPTTAPSPKHTQASPRSGQNYDPVRSSTIDAAPKQFTNPFSPPQSSPLKSANRASASPSISSLIDPPSTSPVSYPYLHASNNASIAPVSTSPRDFNPPPKPHLSPPAPLYADYRPPSQPTIAQPISNLLSTPAPAPAPKSSYQPPQKPDGAMEIDSEPTIPPPAKQTSHKPSTGTSTNPASASHSPKPPRPKDKDVNLPPLPSGNGLLSSALFGGPATEVVEKQAPTVILHVPLNGEVNKYVNFARLAEERYGFNALHPRLAAQRERLARVAAAGALLEKAANGGLGSGISADEMSVDGSDGEGENGDSAMELGMAEKEKSKEESGKEGLKPVRKRKMKEDQYDKEDPFVDDSELAWEEQAAASKDGFFVYSGPLIPEGEAPKVERADGTIRRGRGRGSRGGRVSSGNGRGGANIRPATEGGDPSAPATGTGRGRGRGSGVTRKPRIKKADRPAFEAEKATREKMVALVAKPAGYVAPGLGPTGAGMPMGPGMGML